MWATCFWRDREVQRRQGPGMQSGREVGRGEREGKVGRGWMMKRPVPQAKHISNPEWKGPEGKPTHLTPAFILSTCNCCDQNHMSVLPDLSHRTNMQRASGLALPSNGNWYQMSHKIEKHMQTATSLAAPPHLPNPCWAPWEGWNCRSCWAKCTVHHEKQVYGASSNHL